MAPDWQHPLLWPIWRRHRSNRPPDPLQSGTQDSQAGSDPSQPAAPRLLSTFVWTGIIRRLDPIQKNLDWIRGNLDPIHRNLGWVHGDLDWVHGNLDWVHADLDPIHGDLEWIHRDLDWIHRNLDWVHRDLDWVHGDLDWKFPMIGVDTEDDWRPSAGVWAAGEVDWSRPTPLGWAQRSRTFGPKGLARTRQRQYRTLNAICLKRCSRSPSKGFSPLIQEKPRA